MGKEERETFHFKCYIVSLFILCLVIFSACDNPTDDTTQSDTPKTQVEFNNLEQYPVTVYSDPARLNVIIQVDKLSTVTIPTAPAPLGTAFYPTFNLDLFDVPGLSIPYNAPPIIAMIEDKKTAKVPIPKLDAIEINSAYIKIKNDSDFSLSLRQGNTEILTLGDRIIIVMPGQNTIYEVTPGSVSSYTFMRNASTPVEFPAGLSEFKRGIIYSFTYTNTGLVLTSQTSVLQILPPAVPENVQAEVISNSSVSVTWDEVYGATSYKVYRAASAEGAYSSVGTSVAASYTNVSLSAGQAYYYKITALSGTNRESAKSTAVVAIMSPADVRVTATSANSISLAWNAFSGASGYNIYRSESEDGIYNKVNTAAVTGAEFTDTGLLQDAVYWYKVSAIVDGAEGLLSGQIPASTSSIPDNVRVTAETAKSVSLAWNTVSEASGYNVYRSDSENGIYNQINIGAVTGTGFTDTGLSQDAAYWYKVSAIIDGAEGLLSGQIPASTSSVPGNMRVTVETAKSVSLAWNVVFEASGYNVYRSDSENGIYNQINTGTVTGAEFTDTGLSQDVTYWYKVSAIIDGAEGLLSGQIPASTSSVPGNVRVTAETANSVSLAWNVVSEASGYNVYRSDSENGTYNRINTGTVTFTAFTDTNVSTAYATYFYKVSAVINGIEGIQSSPVSAGTDVMMVPGNSFAAKLDWLKNNATSNFLYLIEIDADTSVVPQILSYSEKNGITIILRGNGKACSLNLSVSGSLFTIDSGVTLILDNNITLNGRTNNTSLVRINNGGTLIMNEGSKITGNTVYGSSAYGGGVYIYGGTFIMNGGKITGNNVSSSLSNYDYSAYVYGGGVYINTGVFTMNAGEISGNNINVRFDTNTITNSGRAYGAGVYIANGIFNMNGGEIFSNTATATTYNGNTSIFGEGGGVYVTSGSVKFRMSGGVIYGSNAAGGLANGTTFGRALYCGAGTAQYGTVDDNTFYRSGDFGTSTNTTIRIVNGNLLTE